MDTPHVQELRRDLRARSGKAKRTKPSAVNGLGVRP